MKFFQTRFLNKISRCSVIATQYVYVFTTAKICIPAAKREIHTHKYVNIDMCSIMMKICYQESTANIESFCIHPPPSSLLLEYLKSNKCLFRPAYLHTHMYILLSLLIYIFSSSFFYFSWRTVCDSRMKGQEEDCHRDNILEGNVQGTVVTGQIVMGGYCYPLREIPSSIDTVVHPSENG